MHTIWVREHNSIADQLATENPDWDDNKLFQEARKQVVGEMQAITANEFLPHMLGGNGLSDYQGYNPEVSPQISNSFSAAARKMRSAISPRLAIRIFLIIMVIVHPSSRLYASKCL